MLLSKMPAILAQPRRVKRNIFAKGTRHPCQKAARRANHRTAARAYSTRVPDAVQRPSRFSAEPGPKSKLARSARISRDAAAGANAKALPAYDYPMARSTLLSYTGTKLPVSDARNSKSSTCFETMTKAQAKQLVVCVENDGYAVSLEKRKIYVALRDAAAEKHNMLRIVDESGEDYLYPKAFFRSIALPQSVRRAVLAA